MTRTTRRLQWTLVLGLSGVLVCSGTANAQSGGSSSSYPGGSSSGGSSSGGSSSGYPGEGGMQAGGAGSGLGSVSNESMDTTMTTTTTTTGADFETVGDTAPLPNTGGEPLLMAMFGSIMAGSALLLRRKLS
ncbi:MAG: hypothetical protein JWN98_1249 [Abditibacteriota bacterium]|nr:hypothetical protein [Abditibacteriota bacterium]